jgi:transposase
MRVQKSPAEYGFNYHDRLRLQKALKQVTDKRTFLRLQAVLLFCQGMNINDVARIAGKGKRAIYYWIDSYLKDHQPNSLHDAPKQGRPVVAQDVTNEFIVEQLRRSPLI